MLLSSTVLFACISEVGLGQAYEMLGGIDCSELLPKGTPEKIRKTARESIDKAKYGYFVGSSSEIHNDIPLENVLAMFEEAGVL